MTIERSTGITVPVWAGTLPGGGYSGDTKELDDAVKACAELLQDAFGKDIVIRFNSNRESGGAWVKNEVMFDAGIGLRVRYKYDGEFPNKKRTNVIIFCAKIDPVLTISGDDYYESFPTIDGALGGLLKNLKAEP